jgi:hypothetical protein
MDMTTIETTTSLIAACQQAGVNGVVRREGHSYVVGQDDSGQWTLSSNNGPAEPVATYVTDNWTVVSTTNDGEDLGEIEEPVETVRDFFVNNLNPWAFVQTEGGGTTFIFTGVDWDNNGKEVVKLIHSRYLNEVALQEDTLAAANAYEAVMEDGAIRYADNIVRLLVRQLRTERASSEMWAKRYEDRAEKLSKAEQDLHTINRKINDYADSAQMCSDYERRIYGWNTDLVSDFQLEGRPGRDFTFHVPVHIPHLSEEQLWVTVDGRSHGIRSPQQARGYVKLMGTTEILKNLYPNSAIEIEITHDDGTDVNY